MSDKPTRPLSPEEIVEHTVPSELPVVTLKGSEAFAKLSKEEQLYAGFHMLAAYSALPIVFQQCSEIGIPVLNLVERIVKMGFQEVKQEAIKVVSDEEYKGFVNYFAKFLYETGPYDSFGSKKFVPAISKDVMRKIFQSLNDIDGGIEDDYMALEPAIYDLSPTKRVLGLPPRGSSMYYKGMSAEEIEEIHSFQQGKLGFENTLVSKEEVEGVSAFVIHVASIESHEKKLGDINGTPVIERGGNFAVELGRSCFWLEEAQKHAANDTEKKMISELISHYKSGELQTHIDYSKTWVSDTNPTVETYAGFIETYGDPKGVRAEFEHLVAIKDKASTAILAKLVANAETIIPRLPWGKALENTAFVAPDFTGIDVVAFATNGLPIGINIPNYDCIRHGVGFKNVSLQNVMKASSLDAPDPKMPSFRFLRAADSPLYRKHEAKSLDIHVALHELYGHGSGKLLNKEDVESLMKSETTNVATGDKFSLTSLSGTPLYYSKEDPAMSNYNGVFGDIASSWEECRAEAVALYLSTDPVVHEVFEIQPDERDEINRVSWLMYMQMGLTGLPAYTADTHNWTQAHCLARFIITRWMLTACPTAVTLSECSGNDGGATGLCFDIDMTKLESHLRPSLSVLLCKLTGFKATANIQAARELVASYGSVDAHYLEIRRKTIQTRKPRKVYQQPTIVISSEGISIEDKPASAESFIQTVIDNSHTALTGMSRDE